VPISKIQSDALGVIARYRDPESDVAGAVPIYRDGPRYSADMDVFKDRRERVAEAARYDIAALEAAGFSVRQLRELPTVIGVEVSKHGQSTRLEWVSDSDYRFFPTVPDPQFGYVLSMADLAVNKLMAAVGRREPRGVIDLLTLHEKHLPLGAMAWAAAEVAPGYTPEGLLAELRRNTRYCAADYRQLALDQSVDADDVARRLKAAIEAAERFVRAMPSEKVGRLFLEDGKPVQPDPADLTAYEEHVPQRRGHWPSSPEIAAAMLERYPPSNE
jgi:hypothetical protein